MGEHSQEGIEIAPKLRGEEAAGCRGDCSLCEPIVGSKLQRHAKRLDISDARTAAYTHALGTIGDKRQATITYAIGGGVDGDL